jgi:hypothetical protein
MPDGGVAAAYLRISWYASDDGSGSALATDDSTGRVAGATGGFVSLSTGPRTPPGQAGSARLRVMLDPVGAASAVLYMDDLWFGAVAAPAATLTPGPAAAPPESPAPGPTTTVRAGQSPTARASATVTAAPTRAATRTPSRPADTPSPTRLVVEGPLVGLSEPAADLPPRTEPSADLARRDNRRPPSGVIAAAAVLLFVLAVAGARYWASRRV